ncbi:YidH family protein [Actinosynnema sp. CS-041913]|uniref:YidH family protein n=1 Tax=Actinosynnema sp. CS-041913 TaxID=3239917 RepID=UPI003D8D79AB
MPSSRARRPRSVYGSGEEPDYRFSFANERTFLAWIRTALALLACGVAVDAVDLGLPDALETALAVLLVGLGLVCAVMSWVRWACSERAMRHDKPLPSFAVGLVLVAGVVVAALVVLVSKA